MVRLSASAGADTTPCIVHANFVDGSTDASESVRISYPDALHVASIFLMAAISLIGTLLPLIPQQHHNSPLKHTVHGAIGMIKLFGVGVMLATALIHKFVPSHELLQSPCLPQVVSTHFDVLSGSVALFGMLLTHTLHLLAAAAMQSLVVAANDEKDAAAAATAGVCACKSGCSNDCHSDIDDNDGDARDSICAMMPPSPQFSELTLADDSDDSDDHQDPFGDNLDESVEQDADGHAICNSLSSPTMPHIAMTRDSSQSSCSSSLSRSTLPSHVHTPGRLIFHQQHQKHTICLVRSSNNLRRNSNSNSKQQQPLSRSNMWHVYVIEFCIALHSLMFGFSLGASSDRFKILLVALSFHQFIEGEALSTIIIEARQTFNNATHTRKSASTLVAILAAYTMITPIGIACGLATHNWMTSESWQAILIEAIVSAFSGGMLLYSALVNVLAPHFQADEFKNTSTLTQISQVAAVWLGVLCMSLAGLWLSSTV